MTQHTGCEQLVPQPGFQKEPRIRLGVHFGFPTRSPQRERRIMCFDFNVDTDRRLSRRCIRQVATGNRPHASLYTETILTSEQPMRKDAGYARGSVLC
jgi:hypothetical protein